MMSRLLLFLVCLGFSPAGASAVDVPTDGWETLRGDTLPPAWSRLFEELQRPRQLRAHFVERRFFSFREKPAVLRGVLRRHAEWGLSLQYQEPEAQTIILTDQAVWLRRADGRTRPAPAAAVEQVLPLLTLLRFDAAALLQAFAVEGRQDGNAWELRLRPLDRAKAATIVLRGAGAQLDQIVLQPHPRRRVEIELHEIETAVAFTAAEEARYFRP